MIKEIKKMIFPDSPNIAYQVHFDTTTEIHRRYLTHEMPRVLIEKLADKYVEDFGDEILKRVQEKTIESKVIQKVIVNLKKELGGR